MRHDTLIERFHEIEQLAEKFHLLETKILGVLNFRDFLQVLQEQIGDIFAVPHVWFSLIADELAAAPIERAARSSKVREHLNLIERERFEKLFGKKERPLLENENLGPYLALLPEREKFSFKSLAMVPVFLGGTLVGSLNLADSSPRRFHPGYNPVHLERLAVKVSLFLSNVTAHEKLQYLAFRDPLTELHNRRAMEQALEREFARATRYHSHLAIAYVDLDLFKIVNDTYGHDCGDALLRHLADGLERMCRKSDMVTRLAGDEFVLLLPETVLTQAELLLQRMADCFAGEPMQWRGADVSIRISYGVASVLEDQAGSPEALLKLADERLYARKRRRKLHG